MGAPDAVVRGVGSGRVRARPPNAAGVQFVARAACRAGVELPDGARELGRVAPGARARVVGGVLVRVLPFEGLLPVRGRRLPR
eukprot:5058688-Lingulodinium_polyedra.AAC.1